MGTYILRRLLLAIPTVIGATIIIFLLMRVVPGDVVDLITGEGRFSDEQKEEIRRSLGLTDPLWRQYTSWLGRLVTFDFGDSIITRNSIWSEVDGRIPVSLELAIGAILISLVIAIPIGTLSALRQDTWVDYVFRVISIGGLSMPSFWIATLLMLGLNRMFNWLPPLQYTPFTENPIENLSQMIWPMLILGYGLSAPVSRMTRSAVLDVLREDYIRTARAKGLRTFSVMFRHCLKNAMLPVLTISALQIGNLIGGSVIMETLFVLPGMGSYIVTSIQQRDYPIVQFAITFMTVTYIMVNLVTDLAYGWLDPRIRYS